MAKDLPYFKFFCSEWNDGDITLESYQTQGLFINICSYYWSNNCEITFSKLKKKFKGFESNFKELIDAEIIKLNDDLVIINFLNEQLAEREESSIVKSRAGKASALARKLAKKQQELNNNSTQIEHVLDSCSTQTQLLREEEIREDKKRKDEIKNKALPFKFFDSLISLGAEKQLVSDWIAVRKVKKLSNTITVFENFKSELKKSGKNINEVLKECVVNSWGGFKSEWLNKQTNQINNGPTKKRIIS